MSAEAWAAFLQVTFDFLGDAVPLVGAGMYWGWCLRGRADRRRRLLQRSDNLKNRSDIITP